MIFMNDRNYSLDLLRIIACLAVIMIHTAGSPIFHKIVEPSTLWYSECLIMDALSSWSVPVFVMLTGFFMINPQKEISIKSLLSKNILRIFVALLFWSFFYALTLNKQALPLGTQEGHFWYLGMLIGIYLSVPILRIIAQYRKVLQYFIVVWFFLMVYKFLGMFIDLPIYNLDYSIFADYVGYCLLGYYLKEINYTFKLKMIIYSGGVVALVINVLYELLTQNIYSGFGDYTSPTVIITSVFIFVLSICNPIKNKKIGNILMDISNCTFGIYLIHLYLLIHTFFRFYRFIEEPILLCLILVPLVFVVGYIITKIIKKIPLLGNYIV